MTDCYQPHHLDFQLAFHCAPTLAGIKTANLISLCKKKNAHAGSEICRCQACLKPKGVGIHPLLEDRRRILLLVYDEVLLDRQLSHHSHQTFLARYGYRPHKMTPTQMLEHLAKRLREGDGEFPHEIGVFLGYPLGDVLGFIHNKGEACKLCGYWKVYEDPKRAQRTFSAYDAARDFYCNSVLRGENIHTIQYGGHCI